ncbi:hypothetical protein GCM10027290_62150 [Micromonospora sonneratiae]
MLDEQHTLDRYEAAQQVVRLHRDRGHCWQCDHAGCWWHDWARAYLAEYQRGRHVMS